MEKAAHLKHGWKETWKIRAPGPALGLGVGLGCWHYPICVTAGDEEINIEPFVQESLVGPGSGHHVFMPQRHLHSPGESLQVEKSHWALSQINKNKSTPGHILGKTIRGKKNRLSTKDADFSSAVIDAWGQWNHVFEVLRGNTVNLEFYTITQELGRNRNVWGHKKTKQGHHPKTQKQEILI